MAFNGEIGHLTGIESPWGNAGGVVRTVEDVEMMARTGVGFIEAGSFTLEPRVGNAWNAETKQFDKCVYYHKSKTGETFNSLGMPNKGMDEVEKEIPEMAKIAHAYGKPLIVNVAPVSSEADVESYELVRRTYEAGADAVLLNAGCPNVIKPGGRRHEILSHSSDALEVVLNGLKTVVSKHKPIFLRISPNDDYYNLVDVLGAIRTDWNHGTVNAIFTPNTWGGFKPRNTTGDPILEVEGNIGGLSGPAVADHAAKQTDWAVKLLNKWFNGGIDLVSSAGIMNAKELNRRLKLGAVAGCGTTFYYESEDWKTDTDRLLTDLAVIGEV